MYVDNFLNEPSLVWNNQDNDFINYNLTNINGDTLDTQALSDNQVITRSYVDQFYQENKQSRWGSGIDFYDESSDLVKKQSR